MSILVIFTNPHQQILWDEATKKWVNKDNEDGAEVESFKPPPKMGAMMGNPPPNIPQQQAPVQQIPQYSQPPVAQPPMENAMEQQQNQSSMNPMMPVAGTTDAMPPSAPNMFKMQKGRSKF
jgi:hypothetical protein